MIDEHDEHNEHERARCARIAPTRLRRRVVAALLLASLAALPSVPASAAAQNDAGSGGDAGNDFASATAVAPRGRYVGRLHRAQGDRDDYYKFFVRQDASLSILVEMPVSMSDPVTLLDPSGIPLDAGGAVVTGISASAALTTEPGAIRVAVHRAPVSGQYRLHLRADRFDVGRYELCFMNCEEPRMEPIDFVFGGALPSPRTRVLLVPPAHGDLGNVAGPTVLDYIDATFRGIRRWTKALRAFATDYRQFSYLREITVEVELFDGVQPVVPAGYDVILGYVAAGPVFRGVAGDFDPGYGEQVLRQLGLGDDVRFSGRVIALSLFSSSPRAGQVLYDFPEMNDLEMVTTHEFGHTFGLGHTRTWHPVLGPDLMNSPATFVYGDGFPGGDGGERTPMTCLSSLDLYGMAQLYSWVPSGVWRSPGGGTSLPPGIPYKWYC